MTCTWDGCERGAVFRDRRYPQIQLCGEHFFDYSEAFMNWLWLGTPRTLDDWLIVFRKSGGTL